MATQLYYSSFVPAFSNIGVPVAEAKLFFYYTQTATLAPVYADAASVVPLSNPVSANLAGKYPSIYLDASITYRVVQTDKNGNPLGDAVDPYVANSAQSGFIAAGTGAVTRTTQDKLRETVSVKDFGAKGDGTTNDTLAFQTAIARSGAALTPGTSVEIYVPDGIYSVDYIGIQGVRVIGQSRLGTILKCRSGGLAAVLDSRYNRDGNGPNTQGSCGVENLSINVNGQSRTGIAAYGGSCVISNVEVYGSATDGVLLQYNLMTTVDNLTTRNNGFDGIVLNVDTPLHFGDVSTSVNLRNVWSLNNGRFGFNISSIHYSSFINCCSQQNGSHGWNIIGDADGVQTANSLVFISCASEVDTGRAFNFKRLRNFSMIDPFILATANQHTVYLDDCAGSIQGLTDTQVHTGGTQSVKIVNSPGLGVVRLGGGTQTMDATEFKYCLFENCLVNNNPRTSVNEIRFNDSQDVNAVRVAPGPFGTDFNGLGMYANDGTRIAFFSRLGGMIIPSGRGAFTDYSPMVAGDIHMYAGTTSLTFKVKGTDGTLRTGTMALV